MKHTLIIILSAVLGSCGLFKSKYSTESWSGWVPQMYTGKPDTLYYGFSSPSTDEMANPLMIWLSSANSPDFVFHAWNKELKDRYYFTIAPYSKQQEFPAFSETELVSVNKLARIFIDRPDISNQQILIGGYNKTGLQAIELLEAENEMYSKAVVILDESELFSGLPYNQNVIYIVSGSIEQHVNFKKSHVILVKEIDEKNISRVFRKNKFFLKNKT